MSIDRQKIEDDFLKLWKDFVDELEERQRKDGMSRGPYIHSHDIDALRKKNQLCCESFESYSKNYRPPGKSDQRVHVSLLPVPFIGDLRRADIFLLMNNWGFEDVDYYAQETPLRDVLLRNLKQELMNEEFPFFCLDPGFSWHAGFRYWEPRLRKVLKKWIPDEKEYVSGLAKLSKRMAVIQRIPYISRDFAETVLETKTSEEVLKYVRDKLVLEACAGKKLLIVLRGSKKWKTKGWCKEIFVNRNRNTYLSPDRDAGARLFHWLQAHPT